MSDRAAAVTRETAETGVEIVLDVDGDGVASIDTGVAFYDHMLESLATHALIDLTATCDGDLDVDAHHTVEDVAIAIGQALDDALGDRRGIRRFADRTVPMDEAHATVVLDVSGRPYVAFEGEFSAERVGGMESQLAAHFVRSLATNAGLTLHVSVEGENAHHEVEALFKALARALDDATRLDDRRGAAPSTKGEL